MPPTSYDQLTTTGRFVFATMVMYRSNGHLWVTKRQLEATTRVPKRTILKVLQDMEKAGWVAAQADINQSNGGHNPTEYCLTYSAPTFATAAPTGL